jgi:hypothetical protein
MPGTGAWPGVDTVWVWYWYGIAPMWVMQLTDFEQVVKTIAYSSTISISGG